MCGNGVWRIDSGTTIEGDEELIDKTPGAFGQNPPRTIVEEDGNVWAGGEVIQFRINAGAADFSAGGSPSADTLTVRITHTNSDSILVENTWVI